MKLAVFASFEPSSPRLNSIQTVAGSLLLSICVLIGSVTALMHALSGRVAKPMQKEAEVVFVEPPKLVESVRTPRSKQVSRATPQIVPAHLKKTTVEALPLTKQPEPPTEIQKTPLVEADPSKEAGVVVGKTSDAEPSMNDASANVAAPETAEAQALPEQASPPIPLASNRLPEYPSEAKATGKMGLVVLKIVIGANGDVEKVAVLRGERPFIEAAVEAVKTWKYQPATIDGKPLRVYRIIKIPFQLRT